MPGGGIRLRSCVALERELQSKLNQARRIGLTRNLTKPDRICRAGRVVPVEIGSGECELRMVERIEKLSPKFETKLVVRSKLRPLEYRQVPVIDARRAQGGINTSFCTVSVSIRRDKAVGVEVFFQLRQCTGLLVASGYYAWTNVGNAQSQPFERGLVRIGKFQGEALLEGCDSIHAPSGHQLVFYT